MSINGNNLPSCGVRQISARSLGPFSSRRIVFADPWLPCDRDTTACHACSYDLAWLAFLHQRHCGSIHYFLGATRSRLLVAASSAALGIGAGVVLLAWPVGGAVSLTLVLIVFFLIQGVASIMYAMVHRQQLSGRWGWMLASGIVDLILAAMIFAGLPGTAAWALGLLVGINMLFGGSALIAMALHARARGPNTSARTL